MRMVVDVPFRGARTYLHSTNVFDFLVARTSADRDLKLTFRRKIACQVEAVSAADIERPDDYPARFSGEGPAGRIDLVLAEKVPSVPIVRRKPYDENAVTDGSRIEGETIRSDADNGASAIERIVANNKRLVAHLIGSQKTLVFSTVRLVSVPPRRAALKIELRSRLGSTLFRSRIYADEAEIGEIVFYAE
ncbi:MAG TPA: hypothetical protein VMF58_11020 [Rhizomicrobium sp.]|nr:hypothetical protein [Rhizomicrobium sp.]